MKSTSMLALMVAGAVSIASVGGALAADKKPAGPKDLADAWEHSDAPLSYAGITIYGTVDVGYSSLSHGAPRSGLAPTSEPFFVGKYSGSPFTGWVSSPLEQSKLGIKGTEKIADDWNFVFKAETGFNPLNGHLVDGVGSIAHANGYAQYITEFPNDSSRAGQVFQGALWGGLSNKTLGTLTYGRQNGLLADVVGGADPMSNAYAFSLIGFSGTLGGGAGDTEDYRLDNSLKYANTFGDKAKDYGAIRVGAEYQFATTEDGGPDWQGSIGWDYKGLSIDAAYARKEGGVSAGATTGGVVASAACPSCANYNSIKATLSDNTAWSITAKYDGGKDNYNLFAGYENISQGNSSNPEKLGVGGPVIGGYLINALTNNAFDTNKVQDLWWVGGKYNFLPNLSGTVAYYHVNQNAFLAGTPAAAGTNCGSSIVVTGPLPTNTTTPSSNCKGSEYAASFLLDYQWTKRIDVYGGVMYSKAEGGYTSGFLSTDTNADDTTVTVGTRLKF